MAPSTLIPTHGDVFAGHLGHLTSAQEEALVGFRDNLVKSDLYTGPTDNTEASHDDPTLLYVGYPVIQLTSDLRGNSIRRFLRARGFVLTLAQKQFSDAEKWRKDHNVGNLYSTFDPVEFETAKRFYPRWTGRRDKMLFLQQEDISEYLENVSISSMWHLRNHLAEASRLATANYPETLNTVAVVNSPSFFPTIWGWIKGWFDEGTRNKIHVLGKDPGLTLRDLVHPCDLPKAYGGELEWTFEEEPNLEDDVKAALDGAMPKGPVIFIDGVIAKPA
ncbi:hypothetical protein C0991_004115 [Blastosporella zonata]|nr:hypothetical protein C0991_004115 [Blastosporella zonata]